MSKGEAHRPGSGERRRTTPAENLQNIYIFGVTTEINFLY